MKRIYFLIFALVIYPIFFILLSAQIRLEGYNNDKINPDLLIKKWDARWITVPSAHSSNDYGVYNFRKKLVMDTIPERYIINVSADNRYKLYVNGKYVICGPSRSDIFNWRFETVDIAPYLIKGMNIVAAVVWDYGRFRPIAQTGIGQCGFIIQGNTEDEMEINTNSSWLCKRNMAFSPYFLPVPGYYVAGPGENFDASKYPWGWEYIQYDDSAWEKAFEGSNGAPKGLRDYSGRLLVPDPLPSMEMTKERLHCIRKATGIVVSQGLLQGKETLLVPPFTETEILLDNKKLTTAYFNMLFSKGKGSEIIVKYAEALYEKKKIQDKIVLVKGNRNNINGKELLGYGDKILPNGDENRHFCSLWWRTYRYISLKIKTANEPLYLHDIYGVFSAYPFVKESSFSTFPNTDLSEMIDIGWRTARLCANETYMDCPYYEQLQYFGDTRIQAMISLYNTRCSRLVKNAIEQGRQSISADGITMSRYPSYPHQFISSFSLWWIGMCYDYWMYRDDSEYVHSLLPAFRSIISWYEQWLLKDGSLGYVPYWFFADWAEGFEYGEPPRECDGHSAFQDLMFIITLDYVAEMEHSLGIPALAAYYRNMANTVRKNFRKKYWDETKQMFADTSTLKSFSQHVNSLAVIAGIVKGEDAGNLMKLVLSDKSLTQATIYFTYYVNLALKYAGIGDLLLENTEVWKKQMDLGLTTWAEQPEPSRSDCHAWGASLNVELFRTTLGISSASPGFKTVRIEPFLGYLTDVEGIIPHPNGNVSVKYHLKDNILSAEISLPDEITGLFIWKGKKYFLKSGLQNITIK